jgi:hypothetical protein
MAKTKSSGKRRSPSKKNGRTLNMPKKREKEEKVAMVKIPKSQAQVELDSTWLGDNEERVAEINRNFYKISAPLPKPRKYTKPVAEIRHFDVGVGELHTNGGIPDDSVRKPQKRTAFQIRMGARPRTKRAKLSAKQLQINDMSEYLRQRRVARGPGDIDRTENHIRDILSYWFQDPNLRRIYAKNLIMRTSQWGIVGDARSTIRNIFAKLNDRARENISREEIEDLTQVLIESQKLYLKDIFTAVLARAGIKTSKQYKNGGPELRRKIEDALTSRDHARAERNRESIEAINKSLNVMSMNNDFVARGYSATQQMVKERFRTWKNAKQESEESIKEGKISRRVISAEMTFGTKAKQELWKLEMSSFMSDQLDKYVNGSNEHQQEIDRFLSYPEETKVMWEAKKVANDARTKSANIRSEVARNAEIQDIKKTKNKIENKASFEAAFQSALDGKSTEHSNRVRAKHAAHEEHARLLRTMNELVRRRIDDADVRESVSLINEMKETNEKIQKQLDIIRGDSEEKAQAGRKLGTVLWKLKNEHSDRKKNEIQEEIKEVREDLRKMDIDLRRAKDIELRENSGILPNSQHLPQFLSEQPYIDDFSRNQLLDLFKNEDLNPEDATTLVERFNEMAKETVAKDVARAESVDKEEKAKLRKDMIEMQKKNRST